LSFLSAIYVACCRSIAALSIWVLGVGKDVEKRGDRFKMIEQEKDKVHCDKLRSQRGFGGGRKYALDKKQDKRDTKPCFSIASYPSAIISLALIGRSVITTSCHAPETFGA
jgi:hypothetical protein